MVASEVCDIGVSCDRFLQQVVAHHRTGDHYPDPLVISDELCFTFAQTEAVLRRLRVMGLIAASPYGPERLRLTPRCWTILSHTSSPRIAGCYAA